GNLDSASGASIMDLIRELNRVGATIVMITHDTGLADQLPRQLRLLDGQVLSDARRDRAALVAPVGGMQGENDGALRWRERQLAAKDRLRVASVGLRSRPLRAALS